MEPMAPKWSQIRQKHYFIFDFHLPIYTGKSRITESTLNFPKKIKVVCVKRSNLELIFKKLIL